MSHTNSPLQKKKASGTFESHSPSYSLRSRSVTLTHPQATAQTYLSYLQYWSSNLQPIFDDPESSQIHSGNISHIFPSHLTVSTIPPAIENYAHVLEHCLIQEFAGVDTVMVDKLRRKEIPIGSSGIAHEDALEWMRLSQTKGARLGTVRHDIKRLLIKVRNVDMREALARLKGVVERWERRCERIYQCGDKLRHWFERRNMRVGGLVLSSSPTTSSLFLSTPSDMESDNLYPGTSSTSGPVTNSVSTPISLKHYPELSPTCNTEMQTGAITASPIGGKTILAWEEMTFRATSEDEDSEDTKDIEQSWNTWWSNYEKDGSDIAKVDPGGDPNGNGNIEIGAGEHGAADKDGDYETYASEVGEREIDWMEYIAS